MEITSTPNRTLYTDDVVFLTCTIILNPAVDSSAVTVTLSISGPERSFTGGMINMIDFQSYQFAVGLGSLTTGDSGNYTCSASVVPVDAMYITGSEGGSNMLAITVGKDWLKPP